MLRKNFLKEKLQRGDVVLGTWAIIPSAVTVDIISSAGLDFVIIDAEHGPISFETAQEMVISCESREVSPVMRVGNVNETDILKAMDIGVHCIQIPNIRTKQDVLHLVKFAKYPPVGDRGFSPFTRAGNYSIENSTILTTKANENTLVAINVEGKEAIEHIDEILEIEAIDIIFIGLFDLSKALGVPGEVTNKKVLDHFANLTKKINAKDKVVGTIATKESDIEDFVAMGLRYIVYLVDCDMLRASYQRIKDIFDVVCQRC
jgi:4-hydroxy-2-oxoheptanedioate aldolase